MKYLSVIFLLFINSVEAEILVSNENVDESYSQTVKVAGEFLVGLQINSEDDSRDLYVYLPESIKAYLCVELSSIDGKYKARLRHHLSEADKGKTKVNFTSKFRDEINEYDNREIAISATIRKSCDSNLIDKRLISTWGRVDGDELMLLIRSSARRDTVYIPRKNNFLSKAKCKKFRKNYNVSYDKYCVIKGVSFQSVKSIEIVRKNLQPIESEILTIN